MREIRVKTLLILLLVLQLGLYAQQLPNQKDVLKSMKSANSYFMNKWPNPGDSITTNKTRPSNIWTRATYYEGLMQLYEITGNKKLYNYAVEWGNYHNWDLAYRRPLRFHADHQCCGQTYIELFQISGNEAWIAKIKDNIDRQIEKDTCDDWSWIDAIQMAMPVYAKLGAIYNDPKYFDKMHCLWEYSRNQHGTNGLYNAEEGLWWRDGDYDPPVKSPLGENVYWSRGNGWVVAALVRVLDVLPEDNINRNEYIEVFTQMCHALVPLQRQDGFWNPSLTDSTHYGGKETSGTAFFVYGMTWGIRNGFLERETFEPVIAKAWHGLVSEALHDNGFLGWMQSTGKDPATGQPLSYTKMPDFEDYGLGAFLLAGSEMYRLTDKKK